MGSGHDHFVRSVLGPVQLVEIRGWVCEGRRRAVIYANLRADPTRNSCVGRVEAATKARNFWGSSYLVH